LHRAGGWGGPSGWALKIRVDSLHARLDNALVELSGADSALRSLSPNAPKAEVAKAVFALQSALREARTELELGRALASAMARRPPPRRTDDPLVTTALAALTTAQAIGQRIGDRVNLFLQREPFTAKEHETWRALATLSNSSQYTRLDLFATSRVMTDPTQPRATREKAALEAGPLIAAGHQLLQKAESDFGTLPFKQ
jgi:hypothetical protein